MCVLRTFKIHSFIKFQIYNAILVAVVTTPHTGCPEPTHVVPGSLYPLTAFTYFSQMLFPDDLPVPGKESASPVFVGKLLTIEAPGKPITPRVNHNVNSGLRVIMMCISLGSSIFARVKKLQCKTICTTEVQYVSRERGCACVRAENV